MRSTALAALIVLSAPAATAAQTSRFGIGPVVRLDRISLEAGASGNTAAIGAVAMLRLSTRFAVEAELTQASRRIERSYDGWFVSYETNPGASREEIERMAPTATRSLGYAPGAGWAAAFRAGGDIGRRVALGTRVGVAARRYLETSTYTIHSIPAGVDPLRVAADFQSSASHRWRGGLLLGLDSSVRLAGRFRLVPELRLVYGGPARIGNKYREFGVGLRGEWHF